MSASPSPPPAVTAVAGDRPSGVLTDPDIELLRRRYEQQLPRFEEAALWAERRVREVLQRYGIVAITTSRAKAWSSLARRIRRERGDPRWLKKGEDEAFDRLVSDVAGCRVIVYRDADVDRASAAFEAELSLLPSGRALQRHRKRTGYRATHLLVQVDEFASRASLRHTVVEVQVVSLAAHLFNELEHAAIYKQDDDSCRQPVRKAVARLRAVARQADASAATVMRRTASIRLRHRKAIESATELAMALKQALRRPVRGAFELVFGFARLVQAPFLADPSTRSGSLVQLWRHGRQRLDRRRNASVDDATAILGALAATDADAFRKFAEQHRSGSRMIASLADGLSRASRTHR